MDKSKYAVYNPHGKPVEELPVIFGFNNGGYQYAGSGFYTGVLLAQDGTFLGDHVCSNESFMYKDLGILEGTREDRHATFRQHYPDGYRMDFVPYEDILQHVQLMAAFKLNQQRKAEEEAAHV